MPTLDPPEFDSGGVPSAGATGFLTRHPVAAALAVAAAGFVLALVVLRLLLGPPARAAGPVVPGPVPRPDAVASLPALGSVVASPGPAGGAAVLVDERGRAPR